MVRLGCDAHGHRVDWMAGVSQEEEQRSTPVGSILKMDVKSPSGGVTQGGSGWPCHKDGGER